MSSHSLNIDDPTHCGAHSREEFNDKIVAALYECEFVHVSPDYLLVGGGLGGGGRCCRWFGWCG